MAAWKVTPAGGRIIAESATLCFEASPQWGLSLGAFSWCGGEGLYPPKSLWPRLHTGTFYDRYALNQLDGALITGESDPLEARVAVDRLEIAGAFRWGDVTLRCLAWADAATGEIVLEASVERSGPGDIRVQLVFEHLYELNAALDGPQAAIFLPVGGRGETLWTFEPSGSEVFDQDGHSVRRGRTLSAPWMAVGLPGAAQVVRFEEESLPLCFMLRGAKKRRPFTLSTYGPNVTFSRNNPLRRRLRIVLASVPEGGVVAAPRDPDSARREGVLRRAEDIRTRLAGLPDAGDNALLRLRRDHATWKLRECEIYLRESEYGQAEGVLADAERALLAIHRHEPAALPKAGEILYETSFREFPHDWDFFGFCETHSDPEKGFHLAPVITTDMWTRREFSGSYVVEFEFCPTGKGRQNDGGTFLQLAGQCLTPVGEFDFMASATGYMPHYNFGIGCYHLSFNRADLSVCNFRKTGRGFYLLAQIPEPVRERDRWYRLHVVKNDRQFLFFVDGRLALEYIDEGHQGTLYETGRIGIRNWGRQASWFRNFKVYRPAP